jgi:hypothetical protein
MLFRLAIEALKSVFVTVWETVKLWFKLMWDGFKLLGKQIAYVMNPKNWGDGFGEGLAKIVGGSIAEMGADFKKYGENIGNSFIEGADRVINGGAGKISKKDLFALAPGSGAVKKAEQDGKAIGNGIARGVSTGMQTLDLRFTADKVVSNFQLTSDKIIADLRQMVQPIKNTIEFEFGGMITDSIVSFTSDLFSNIASGMAPMRAVLMGFLQMISEFAINFGKQLIALGTATLAAKALFKNPLTALAAGVALVALGTISKKIMSGAPKFAAGGIVPGSSYSGDRVPILANSGEMVLNPAQQASLFKQLNGGGGSGGILTARVSGNDLLFVLETARKRQGNIY